MKITIEKLQEIFKSVFDQDTTINSNTSKADIGQWDSLAHLNLIVELEDNLGITFSKEEIANIKSVQDILNFIENK